MRNSPRYPVCSNRQLCAQPLREKLMRNNSKRTNKRKRERETLGRFLRAAKFCGETIVESVTKEAAGERQKNFVFETRRKRARQKNKAKK